MAVEVIYDGDCPFCTSFVKLMRLREALGPVTLIDARNETDPRVADVRRRHRLNDGFVVIHADREYYGPEALEFLSLATSDAAWSRVLFRLPLFKGATGRWAYPKMVAGRKLALRLLGRSPLSY